MEIGASSFSGAALQQQYNVQKNQSDYVEQTRAREQASSSSEVTTARAEASRVQAAQAQESNAQSEQAEAPKVFVNAQGQKTGTIISVTA
jgi:hypothetical protein